MATLFQRQLGIGMPARDIQENLRDGQAFGGRRGVYLHALVLRLVAWFLGTRPRCTRGAGHRALRVVVNVVIVIIIVIIIATPFLPGGLVAQLRGWAIVDHGTGATRRGGGGRRGGRGLALTSVQDGGGRLRVCRGRGGGGWLLCMGRGR